MAGLWRNNPETPEGKYPIVLRRNGKPVQQRYFVLLLKDPGAKEALLAYAMVHSAKGTNPKFVEQIRDLADEAAVVNRCQGHTSNPAKGQDCGNDDVTLSWARSIGCPGS